MADRKPQSAGATPKPDTNAPTAAQLKRAHETGALGDKVAHPDPGAAPLGVDDEAAGRPTWREPERVAMAQAAANKAAEPSGAQPAAAPDPEAPPIPRPDTSGRFQFAVMAGALVIIIAALLARMLLG